MRIRPARTDEAALLSDLALRSKAYWPYSREFIEACRESLTVTADYIGSSEVWVGQAGEAIVGFYGFEDEPDGVGLAFFFVEPGAILSGTGRRLLEHARQRARALGHAILVIEADPHAEGFYLKMGADRIGERESSVGRGRMNPLLQLDLQASATTRG
jgi:GNAT superfamily N-acetyltransferase